MQSRNRAVAVVLTLIALSLPAAAKFQPFTITVKCVGVSDGDTISVMHKGKAARIRLHGIDCPESNQAFGTKAKQATSKLVFGKMVAVKVTDKDRYGRLVGVVVIDKKSLKP